VQSDSIATAPPAAKKPWTDFRILCQGQFCARPARRSFGTSPAPANIEFMTVSVEEIETDPYEYLEWDVDSVTSTGPAPSLLSLSTEDDTYAS